MRTFAAAIIIAALIAAGLIWLGAKRHAPSPQPALAPTPPSVLTSPPVQALTPTSALNTESSSSRGWRELPSEWKTLTFDVYKFGISYPAAGVLVSGCNITNATLP